MRKAFNEYKAFKRLKSISLANLISPDAYATEIEKLVKVIGTNLARAVFVVGSHPSLKYHLAASQVDQTIPTMTKTVRKFDSLTSSALATMPYCKICKGPKIPAKKEMRELQLERPLEG